MSDSEDERNTHRRRLFVKEDGRPAKFYLDPSIHREGQRQKLRADIEAYGGRVASTDGSVDTVLISAAYDDIELLRLRYGANDDRDKRAIHVERLSFVQHCIQQKKFKHRVPIIKGMGGQLGHKHATKFTESDDQHLCGYLARTLPRKEAGGRSGNRIYQRLVALGVRFPEYLWARRHTFHAWRERYKKKKHIFDPIIEEIAKEDGTYDNRLWPEDRRMSRRKLRTGRRMEDESSEGEEYDLEEEEEEEEDQLREDQEEGEGELSEDDRSLDGETGQQIEAPEDRDFEGRPVQDVEFDRTEIKKRKRVQAPGQVTKKRRNDQNMSPSYPVRPKGKEIAHESDQGDDDDEMANTSLFSVDEEVPQDFDNEPGPSNTLQSPDRTLADPPSKSNHQQVSLTQATLVNTQSRMEFEPVSHSTSANRRHSGNASRSQPISLMEEQEEGRQPFLDPASLPPPSPRPAQPPPMQRITAGTSRGGQDAPPNPTETIQPTHRGAKPLSKQRAPFTIVQPNDAPYRNTRARSRSVEPVAMPPPKYKPTRRRKQNPEAVEMEVRKEAWTNPDRIPVTETIEEEMDVEQTLITKDANIGTTVRPREPSLETDDAQTRQNLHPPSSGRPSAGRSFLSNKTRPSDVLRKFSESSSSSRRYSKPFFQRPPTQNVLALDENRRPRWSEPQVGFGTFNLPEPRTPMNVPRTRQESVSSVESFPIKGTRASAAKKEMQEQEKHSPYKPPEGTRAAQVAMSRNTR